MIPKHKIGVGWYDPIGELLSSEAILFRIDKGIFEEFAIDVDVDILNGDDVAGQSNDALNIICTRLWRRIKDDHIPTGWRMKEVGPLIDLHQLFIVEVGLHAEPINGKVLECYANKQEYEHSQDDGFDDLTYEPMPFFKVKLNVHAFSYYFSTNPSSLFLVLPMPQLFGG